MTIEVKSLNELTNEPLPSIYFWIRPLLPVGGLLLLVGDVKTYKSWLALAMGYDCARGKPVLNRFDVPKPLSVLYVEAEVGPYELRERATYVNVDPSIGGENFKVVSKNLSIQLDTSEGIKLLSDAIEKAKPDILILDPIVEFHSQNENLAIEMKKMLMPIRLLQFHNKMGLILVHHTAKMSEFRGGGDAQSARGSYLPGAANTIINITKPVKTRENRIQLSFTLRASRAPVPMTLDFNDGKFEEV